LAAAVACKTNIILAVPFFFICLFAKKVPLEKLVVCVLVFISSFCLINLPYIASEGFLHMVFLNSKQTQIFDVVYSFAADRLFYFVPAVYLVLLDKAVMIKGIIVIFLSCF
jgi:uncharacterized membrane protein